MQPLGLAASWSDPTASALRLRGLRTTIFWKARSGRGRLASSTTRFGACSDAVATDRVRILVDARAATSRACCRTSIQRLRPRCTPLGTWCVRARSSYSYKQIPRVYIVVVCFVPAWRLRVSFYARSEQMKPPSSPRAVLPTFETQGGRCDGGGEGRCFDAMRKKFFSKTFV